MGYAYGYASTDAYASPFDAMFAAAEPIFLAFCACDTSACTEYDLEGLRTELGPLCCNPDFYSGPLGYDCTGVTTMSFMDFMADDGNRLRRLTKGKPPKRDRRLSDQSSGCTSDTDCQFPGCDLS